MTKRKAPDDRCPDNYRTPHAMSDAEIAAVLGVSRQRVMFIASRAMRKYARHTPACYWWSGTINQPHPCDCGYDELIKEIGE